MLTNQCQGYLLASPYNRGHQKPMPEHTLLRLSMTRQAMQANQLVFIALPPFLGFGIREKKDCVDLVLLILGRWKGNTSATIKRYDF
jgi:hypothetical protein